MNIDLSGLSAQKVANMISFGYVKLEDVPVVTADLVNELCGVHHYTVPVEYQHLISLEVLVNDCLAGGDILDMFPDPPPEAVEAAYRYDRSVEMINSLDFRSPDSIKAVIDYDPDLGSMCRYAKKDDAIAALRKHPSLIETKWFTNIIGSYSGSCVLKVVVGELKAPCGEWISNVRSYRAACFPILYAAYGRECLPFFTGRVPLEVFFGEDHDYIVSLGVGRSIRNSMSLTGDEDETIIARAVNYKELIFTTSTLHHLGKYRPRYGIRYMRRIIGSARSGAFSMPSIKRNTFDWYPTPLWNFIVSAQLSENGMGDEKSAVERYNVEVLSGGLIKSIDRHQARHITDLINGVALELKDQLSNHRNEAIRVLGPSVIWFDL